MSTQLVSYALPQAITMPTFEIPKAKPPLRRTYWVVENKFLAGAYAGHPEPQAHEERLRGLLNAGVRTVVNLMEEDEYNNAGQPFVPYQDLLHKFAAEAGDHVDCLRFPVVDVQIPTHEGMLEILNAIDASLEKDRPVYVHCFGGIGRTGTVVCCWLLRHGHANKANVFEVLRGMRTADVDRASRQAPENDLQRDFVQAWLERPID